MLIHFLFILGAVHKTPRDSPTTDDRINDFISKWLRNSTDRKGGRKLRDKPDGDPTQNTEKENSRASEENTT